MTMYVVARTIQFLILLISKLVTVKSVGCRKGFSPCHINLSHCCEEKSKLLQLIYPSYTKPVLQFCNIGSIQCTVAHPHYYRFKIRVLSEGG